MTGVSVGTICFFYCLVEVKLGVNTFYSRGFSANWCNLHFTAGFCSHGQMLTFRFGGRNMLTMTKSLGKVGGAIR